MAEVAVKFFLQKLDTLLLQEPETISGLSDRILLLKIKLEETQCFLRDADRREGEETVCDWLRELRDSVYVADDLIDKFIIQIHNHDGLDPFSIESYRTQFEEIDAQVAETLRRKSQFGFTDVVDQEGEDREEERKSSTEINEGGGEDVSSFFNSNFRNLPYYLKSCFLYCCIFPDNTWIPKGRLVRLLVAEDLVQEREGETAESIAEKYLRELVDKGMLEVAEGYPNQGTKFKVPNNFRELSLHIIKDQMFVTSCASPDTQIPLNTRRISIHGDVKNVPTNLNDLLIRSLFVFGIKSLSGSSWDHLKTVFSGVKLLRVLDLEGVKIEDLPVELGDLIHLRYLGLKNSNITDLPESLSKLKNLQTLDIKWNGDIAALSSAVLSLLRLRHLKMFKNWHVPGKSGVRLPSGIGKLGDLQTLTGFYAGDGIANELNRLTQLRKLGVKDVSENHAIDLYDSIKNMESLVSLSLEAQDKPGKITKPLHRSDNKVLPLETFSPPSSLQKLRLEGTLEKIPESFMKMENLIKLRLGFSHLTEDPGSVLQFLPNLKCLSLWHAYDGKEMGREFCGAGGFPNLEDLSICSHVLEEWTEIGEGALPSLKCLHLHNCLKLRMLPEGLQNISTLQKLDLLPLLDEHEQRLRSEESYKIEHIPLITSIPYSVVQRLAESHLQNTEPETAPAGSS